MQVIVFYLFDCRNNKETLKNNKKYKQKHNKIFMLAKSKLNSIEILVIQALIDLEISHEEFKTIVNEEENYRRFKEYIIMIKSGDKLSENNKNIRENSGKA